MSAASHRSTGPTQDRHKRGSKRLGIATCLGILLLCVSVLGRGWVGAEQISLQHYLPRVLRQYEQPSGKPSATATMTVTGTPSWVPLPSETPTRTPTIDPILSRTPTATAPPTPPPCGDWLQVNDDAFGLGDPSHQDPPFLDEDVFEVAVHDGQLYVGMEADNGYGARLWRSKRGVTTISGQADWEQVVVDAFGSPDNDHIDSLASFRGYIYATTADWMRLSSEIWRSPSGDLGTWEQVNLGRFGSYPNRNSNMRALAVPSIQGDPWLCGGTGNSDVGAQMWCTSDGRNWAQKNRNGFGLSTNYAVRTSAVHDGALYVGVWPRPPMEEDEPLAGSIWRSRGEPDPGAPGRWLWEQVLSSEDSRDSTPLRRGVNVLASYAGHLYAAIRANSGLEIWRSESGDLSSWERVTTLAAWDFDIQQPPTDGSIVLDGALYVSLVNRETGAQIWRTCDGTTWKQVVSGGFGDARTALAQLAAFNGYLYAWAGNYYTGQKVFRAECVPCFYWSESSTLLVPSR